MQNEQQKELTKSQQWEIANKTLTEINQLISTLPDEKFLAYIKFFAEFKRRLQTGESLNLAPLDEGSTSNKENGKCDVPKFADYKET